MNWAEIKEVVLTSLPRTIVLSSHQLSILILLAIGSFMATGSIAIFNFAFNLQSVPLMIVGVSYSVAAFPTLSKLFGAGESTRFVEQVSLAVRHILFWSLPIISLFIVLRAQIVRVILGSGEFSWTDTRLTAAALAIFIISVAGQSLIQLFVRSYYAGGKTREPLIINSLSSVMVVLLTVLLLRAFDNYPIFRYFIESLLRVDDVSATPVLMLPFGFTLGMLLNTVLLWYYFQKDFGLLNRQIANTFFQSFSAAVCAGFISYITLTIFAGIFDLNTFWGILGQGLLAGIGGIIATIIILRILGSHELAEFIEAFRARFRRTRPIVAEPEEL